MMKVPLILLLRWRLGCLWAGRRSPRGRIEAAGYASC